ncbi:MAG: hypothetical protein DCC57_08605 [Chloroflexi bacterium]|nr:MAG: hypothetical protein DCC57_08605 [Chloroflexota bacterium]
MASEEWRLRLEAADHFYALRRRANLAEFWAWLTRRCNRLLRFEELAGPRRAQPRLDGGYRHVPIHAIVGSVGRAQDFTPGFLPRASVEAERWIRLYTALQGLAGFPEVELIQVGDRYIVEDGHHRISVARAAGLTEIAAHVTYLPGAPALGCCTG